MTKKNEFPLKKYFSKLNVQSNKNILFIFQSIDANNDVQHKINNLPVDGDKGKFREVKGKCGNDTQFIIIEWIEVDQINTLNLTFSLIPNTTAFGLNEAIFNLSSNIVPSSQDRTILSYIGKNTTIPTGAVNDTLDVLGEDLHEEDNRNTINTLGIQTLKKSNESLNSLLIEVKLIQIY